jgi:hypothetical protein
MQMALLLVIDPELVPDVGDLIGRLVESGDALRELVGYNLLAAFCLHRTAQIHDDALTAWVAFVRERRVCTEYDVGVHCEALARVGGVGEVVAQEMRRDLRAFVGDPAEIFGDDGVVLELVQLGG